MEEANNKSPSYMYYKGGEIIFKVFAEIGRNTVPQFEEENLNFSLVKC